MENKNECLCKIFHDTIVCFVENYCYVYTICVVLWKKIINTI